MAKRNTSKPIVSTVPAKSNLRVVDDTFMSELQDAGYTAGSAFRATVDLLKSGKIDWKETKVVGEMGANYRRGHFASFYATRDASKVSPGDLKDHAYRLADALISTAIKARTAEQTRLYNAGKSGFGHACKVAGMPVKVGKGKGKTRTPKGAGDDVLPPVVGNEKTSIDGEVTVPKVTTPDAGMAQAMNLANILDRAIKLNGATFHHGLLAVLADCVADVRSIVKEASKPAA
jgi:hypothetical protein